MSVEQKSTHITTNKHREGIKTRKHEVLRC
jgi:hypothetical protein